MSAWDQAASALLPQVKNYLNITWEDEATDEKIRGLMLSAMAYLDGKRGYPAEYEKPGFAQTLMMEYVRYGRDGALDVFENNYQSMILAMRNERRAFYYVAEAIPAEG